MLLTVSKRVDFSASRRLFSAKLGKKENLERFGEESAARHGTGRNYTAYFVFAGQPDATTGMLINISEIKERAGSIINDRYDHCFLNEDNDAFGNVVPTAENVARQLWKDVAPLFSGERAQLVAVHLRETADRSATAYADGTTEANLWFEFSAARRTVSPHLSQAENERLFGVAVAEHGHNYRARLTFPGEMPAHKDVELLTQQYRRVLDNKNLNSQVDALRDQPVTTESLARFILQARSTKPAISRVRLHERDDFFAEAWHDRATFLGMRGSFSAAHRLHVGSFTAKENEELFGKCNNPRGHGHTYVAEATVGGGFDQRSGTVFGFDALRHAINHTLAPWKDRHLDLETSEFGADPSTGENIVRALWPKLDAALQQHLVRLRLWETRNNRFTLRRTP